MANDFVDLIGQSSAKRLLKALETTGREIASIEEECDREYGLCLLKRYRDRVEKLANSEMEKASISRYWEECALEHLTRLDQVSIPRSRIVPSFGYRSMFLDDLAKRYGDSAELEPTLARISLTKGMDQQAGYDVIRDMWQMRAKEADRVIKTSTIEEIAGLREPAMRKVFHSLAVGIGERYGFKQSTRAGGNLLLTDRLREADMNVYICRGAGRFLELGQVRMVVVLVPANISFRLAEGLPDAPCSALELDMVFPGYRDSYGTFKSARELELVTMAAVVCSKLLIHSIRNALIDQKMN